MAIAGRTHPMFWPPVVLSERALLPTAVLTSRRVETKTEFAPKAVARAWQRIKFTNDVSTALITKAVHDVKDAGFLKGSTDTSKLVVTF